MGGGNYSRVKIRARCIQGETNVGGNNQMCFVRNMTEEGNQILLDAKIRHFLE
jgi:hypothetical protein